MNVNPALRPAARLLNISMLLHAVYLAALLCNHLLLAQGFFPEGVSAFTLTPLLQIGYAFLRFLVHCILYSSLRNMTRADYTGEAQMTAALAAYFILDFICGHVVGLFQNYMTAPKFGSFGGDIGVIVAAHSYVSTIASFIGILLSASVALIIAAYGIVWFYYRSLEGSQR